MARYQKKRVRRRRSKNIAAFGMVLLAVAGLIGCGSGSGGTRLLASVQAIASTPTVANLINTPSQSSSKAGCSLTTYIPNFGGETDPATGHPNRLLHWGTLPAHVYFVPGQYLTPQLKAQAAAGFNWWGKALGKTALYQEVATPSAANIIVKCEMRGETNYGAITDYHFDTNHQLLDATMTFNMTYLADISQIAPVAAHEFGHALGIAGHSNDHSDVMSSSSDVYEMTGLSERDLNTLKTAYCGLLLDQANSNGSSNGSLNGTLNGTLNGNANETSSAVSKGVVQTIVSILCGFGLR